MGHARMHFFDKHDGGELNHMRFGATSWIGAKAKASFGAKSTCEAGSGSNRSGFSTGRAPYFRKAKSCFGMPSHRRFKG